MSITVLNYLDHELVKSVTEQAAARAKAAAVSADKDFSTVLDETSQALSSTNDTASQYPNTVASANIYSTSDLESIFDEAASAYGVSATILKAIAKAESGFNPSAVSRAGAVGVMQLMPATAASLGVTNSYDARENIMGGAKYISQLLSKYQGNISLALAAYNAGSGNVEKYGGIPPFTETQNYVQKVLSYMNGSVTVGSAASSIFGLTGIAREQANQMLGNFFSSKNISKESLDLLALLLRLKSSTSPAATTSPAVSVVPESADTNTDTNDVEHIDTDDNHTGLGVAYTGTPVALPVPDSKPQTELNDTPNTDTPVALEPGSAAGTSTPSVGISNPVTDVPASSLQVENVAKDDMSAVSDPSIENDTTNIQN